MDYEQFYNDIESLLFKYKNDFNVSRGGTLLDKVENVFYDYAEKINECSRLEDDISDSLGANSEYRNEIDTLQEENDTLITKLFQLEESINQYRNVLLENNLSEHLL